MTQGSSHPDPGGPAGPQRVVRLLEARTVAVVGASTSPGPGRNVVRNLDAIGYTGRVFLVNRSHPLVDGVPAFGSLEELPEIPELVVVAVNRRATVEVVRSAAAFGVPAAVLLAAGFRETGEEGARLEDELVSARGAVSLVGPNCLGVANYAGRFAAYSGPLVEQKEAGNVALVSNSGALACTLAGAAAERRIAFSHVVTMGNQVDLGLADFVGYFASEPSVEVIACYVEGFDDGRAVLSAIEAAEKQGKLVVLLKSGRTRVGGRAARTHTGALAGSATVQESLFSRSGVLLARDLEELLALVELGSRSPHLAGRSLGVVTTSGGERLLLADAIEEHGLDLAELSEGSKSALQAVLPSFATATNPLDTTGAGIFEGDVGIHAAAIKIVAKDAAVDVLLASYDAKNGWADSAQSAPAFVDGVVAAHRAGAEAGKPVVVVSLTTGTVDVTARDYLAEHRVACLMGLQPAMRALSLLLGRAAARSRDGGGRPEPVAAPPGPVTPRLFGPGEQDGVQLPHTAASARLAAAGLEVGAFLTAAGEEEAVVAAAELGYPVALKWDADVPHRARLGGVVLGVTSEQAVRRGWRELASRAGDLGIDCNGVVVQPMVYGGTHLFVGAVRDLQFGPIVLFGLGGTEVEQDGQVAVALAPLTPGDAERLVADSPCAALLRGREQTGFFDREATIDAVVAVATLIRDPAVLAVDVNPLIALPKGVAVVDCKVVVRPGSEAER